MNRRKGDGSMKRKKVVSGTGEWAASNENIQRGCENGCLYCYAASMAIHYGRATASSWTEPTLNETKIAKGYARRAGRIMFPTTHDITPANLDACMTVLAKMLRVGNEVLIVSKPHLECVKRICEVFDTFKEQILFRFTIGSASDDVLGFWEPNAPPFQERLACLRHARQMGYQTSVSCEPMLDLNPEAVAEACREFISDAIWFGMPKMLGQRVGMNSPDNADAKNRAKLLVSQQTKDWLERLYSYYRNDPLVKWKDSIKEVVGLERPTEKGLDV